MSTPAKFGAIIYANDISSLSQFYIDLFGMEAQRKTAEFISIEKDGFNLLIHTPPIALPDTRFNSVKVFLTVDSLSRVSERATQLGGEALSGEWANPFFKVCNIADSEGNHIQLREFLQ